MCLTETYILYELDRHIGITVKKKFSLPQYNEAARSVTGQKWSLTVTNSFKNLIHHYWTGGYHSGVLCGFTS